MKAFFALLLLTVAIPARAQKSESSFGPDFQTNYADYATFKFWVTTIGRGRCGLDATALQRRLYPLAYDHVQPKFDYWTNGQPSGPTFHIRVTSSELGAEMCSHIIESDVDYYAREGANFPNIVANYMGIGPQMVIARNSSDDIDTVVEGIQGQLRFFTEGYRAGGYQRKQ